MVLAAEDAPSSGDDKTSICFSFDDDRPGILFDVMGEFARAGINLAKVESRPNKESLGRYIFLVDLDGHRDDPAVWEALKSVEAEASMVKVFGSYPKYVDS